MQRRKCCRKVGIGYATLERVKEIGIGYEMPERVKENRNRICNTMGRGNGEWEGDM